MANELQHRDADTGLTLYFTLRKPNGAAQMWSVAAADWEALTVANWGDYDLAITETPASSYLYLGSLPAIAGNMTPGWYWAEVYEQAGASPAIGDEIKGRYLGYWDGSTFRYWTSDAYQLLAAQRVIDQTTTPWQLVLKDRDTDAELLRYDLQDENGDPIDSIATFVAEQTTPA